MGTCSRPLKVKQLVDAIRRCVQGEATDQPGNDGQAGGGLPAMPRRRSQPGDGVQLSEREHEVLQQIARGASNKEIARDAGNRRNTVKIHVQHILRKLGLSSRVQAAVYAAARG